MSSPVPGPPLPGEGSPHVLVVPGLGLLGYLHPLLQELGRRGVRATLLDVPGHDRLRHVIAATVPSIAAATAEAAVTRPAGERVVLLGHSTGAQAALQAALLLQDRLRLDAVVLAGPHRPPTRAAPTSSPWLRSRRTAGTPRASSSCCRRCYGPGSGSTLLARR